MYLSSAVNPVQYISLIIALSVLYVIDISTAKHWLDFSKIYVEFWYSIWIVVFNDYQFHKFPSHIVIRHGIVRYSVA